MVDLTPNKLSINPLNAGSSSSESLNATQALLTRASSLNRSLSIGSAPNLLLPIDYVLLSDL